MEECFFPARVGIFSFVNNMIKVLFPICTLIWRVNNYVSRQGKLKIREMKVQLLLYKLSPFNIVRLLTFDCLYSEDFSLILKEEFNFIKTK